MNRIQERTMNKLRDEPVMTGAVISAIISFLVMLVSLGWVDISGEQMEAIKGFLVAFLPVLVVVVTLIGGWYGRQKVVPVQKLMRNNVHPDDLEGPVGERVADRLYEMATFIDMGDKESFRRQR